MLTRVSGLSGPGPHGLRLRRTAWDSSVITWRLRHSMHASVLGSFQVRKELSFVKSGCNAKTPLL